VAAEVTLTCCAPVTVPAVLLQVNVSELGVGTSAEPPPVVMVMVTGMKRVVPTVPIVPVGVNVSPVLAAVVLGSVPMQPGAIEKTKLVAELADDDVTFSPVLT